MEQPFYRDILTKHGIEALVPEKSVREWIHNTIVHELGKGVFKVETRTEYLAIMESLKQQGARGVILGCTEIPMLLTPEECPMLAYDTTQIHATAAVDFALS